MDYRGVLLVGLVGGAAIFGATTSCSAPDPGQITFSERPRGSGGELTSGGTTSGGTDGGSSGTTSGGTDGGGTDGGSSGAAADPVFGTTAFAAGSTGQGAPAKAANPAHNGDSSGKDCMVAGCHLNQWGFGGTLYTDAAGTARVAGVDVSADPHGARRKIGVALQEAGLTRRGKCARPPAQRDIVHTYGPARTR